MTAQVEGIHSKSEDSGIYYPAKKFELSANFFKNATKWPKMTQNDPKWPKHDPKLPKITPNCPKMTPGFSHFFRNFFLLQLECMW